MQITFTGRNNLEITPALKKVTQEKLQTLSRYHTKIENINVVFSLENIDHVAEATIHLDSTQIHATAKSDDMYAAVDELEAKLARQLITYKEKSTDHR